MAFNIVKIKRNGGVPQIKLIFGFAQFAKYRIMLWDKTGQNPVEIAHGVNIDSSPDNFPIGDPKTLDGRFITWQAVIATPTGGAGQQWSQRATFVQDDTVCPDSPFNQGPLPLSNTVTTFDQARFQVVD
jgi:hypothetical protein